MKSFGYGDIEEEGRASTGGFCGFRRFPEREVKGDGSSKLEAGCCEMILLGVSLDQSGSV